jgi:hypothetical protein
MSGADSPSPALDWTVRLLAGGCLFGAWTYISFAIRAQSPDDYWLGIALAGEAVGLLRRLHWARVSGLLGLAFAAAWGFSELLRAGATVGNTLALGGSLLAALVLARHPQHFPNRWW